MKTILTNHSLVVSATKFYSKVGRIEALCMVDLRDSGELVDYEFVPNAKIAVYFESNESLVKFQMKYL